MFTLCVVSASLFVAISFLSGVGAETREREREREKETRRRIRELSTLKAEKSPAK